MVSNDTTNENVQGVQLQEIEGAKIVQKYKGDQDVELASGTLKVLMVSVPVENFPKQRAQDNTDVWLVLEIGSDFSLPIKASQTVIPERANRSYLFPSSDIPDASVQLSFRSTDKASIEAFEETLSDYCAFRAGGKDVKCKGELELLDERGHLIGTIDGPWQLQEDSALHRPGHEKDPVILELPESGQTSSSSSQQQVQVHAAPYDERGQLQTAGQNDWLLNGAYMVSRKLEKGSEWAGTKMLKAADSYVKRTTPPGSRGNSTSNSFDEGYRPNEKLLSDGASMNSVGTTMTNSGRPAKTFSPKTHNTARQIRNVSGKVTQVSNKTSAAIMSVASNLGDQIGKRTGIQQASQSDGSTKNPTGFRKTLNRSLIAFNVVLDGVTNSAERILKDGGEASGRVIEHRYGSEAKVISGNVASVGRSAFVVYKDINGVRRKALLKIATGTIRARAPNGEEIILQQEKVATSSISDSSAQSDVVTEKAEPPSYGQATSQLQSNLSEKK